MSRPTFWKIADLIDFEFLLAAETGAEELQWRGRLLDLPAGDDAAARRSLFKTWLGVRRSEAGGSLPGESVAAGWGSVLLLSLLAGLVLGVSVTAALLHYKGGEPVNVSWFLACTLGVQLLVLVIAVAIWLLRAATDWFDDFHPMRGLLAGLVWLCSAGLRRLPGAQRESLRASLAILARKREIYGSLATWPFLIVTQLFGVAFNIGILGTMLAHLAFTNMHFQWESTWVKSPAAAYRIVADAALPWSGFASSPHPTLAEIEESHNIDRISFHKLLAEQKPQLAALKSWWPFLCYAVAFYGLLVRAALLVFAMVKLRAGLRGLTFDHEGCNALFRRLTGPLVETQAETAVLEIPEPATRPTIQMARSGACIALVAADVELSAEQLTDYIRKTFGWSVGQTLSAEIDYPGGSVETLAKLAAQATDCVSIVIVVHARRDPIKAIALFLQKVSEKVGPKPELILLLVGQRSGACFAPVEAEEFKYWHNFQAIHGLRLSLEKWNHL